MSKRSRLLDQSCAWIREHWNATNFDVPDELLHLWIHNRGDDEPRPAGFHLAVFTFGLVQYDLVSNHVPAGVKRAFPSEEILRLFDLWQMKLALTELQRKTEVKTRPLPLFAFPANERVEVLAGETFLASTQDVRR